MLKGLMLLGVMTLGVGCATAAPDATTDGDDTADSAVTGGKSTKAVKLTADAKAGLTTVRGLLGLPEKADTSNPSSKRQEALAQHALDLLNARDPGALDAFGKAMASKDADTKRKGFVTFRKAFDAIVASDDYRAAVAADPLFPEAKSGAAKSGAAKTDALRTETLHPQSPPLAPQDDIPNLGRGPDGRFGDGNTGFGGRVADIPGLAADLWPWGSLGKVDSGELVPDPDSRLGAYAATKGYPPGTVGNAVHNAIGTIYVTFGTYGEERIGRVFNSAEARALYSQPVDSPAGYRMASIELRYWNNVLAEDSWSPGGELGSLFNATVRDWLQRNPFSLTNAALSKTDCGDKEDGWWCLDMNGNGSGFMAYCQGKQIAGGCECAACSTAGTHASCSADAPPAACPN